MNVANSTSLRSGVAYHYSHGRVAGRVIAYHHRTFHHAIAWRTDTKTVHRHFARSIVARAHNNEGLAREKTALGGGLMSGIASVYSGGRTANGEVAAAGGLTAAHRSLPFGTLVKVTNTGTGRSVVVRINDRGPFVRGRVIDLTPAGARALGFSGLAPVTLSIVDHG
jgi:rare lipoprotein A